MPSETVSFDEVKAALLEEKASGKIGEKAASGSADAIEHSAVENSRQALAKIVEKPSTQLLTIFFTYLDIIGRCLLLSSENTSPIWNIIFLFTSVFFTCELLLQALLFHTRFFSHWGCLVDTVLIAMRFGTEYTSLFEMNQTHLVLLNFLRCWRFAKLLNSVVSTEKQKCAACKKKLKSQIESTNEWKAKALSSEDQVKTLREALRIASIDVAAAMLGKVNPELLGDSIKDDHVGDELNDMQVVMEDSSISTED